METKLEAHTQFDDMMGTVAIDWHDDPQFREKLKKLGVDTDGLFPIAIEIYEIEGTYGFHSVSVYVVEESAVATSRDGIVDYAKRHGNKIPVKKFYIECSPDQLIKAFKRFAMVAKRPWAKDFVFEVEEPRADLRSGIDESTQGAAV